MQEEMNGFQEYMTPCFKFEVSVLTGVLGVGTESRLLYKLLYSSHVQMFTL